MEYIDRDSDKERAIITDTCDKDLSDILINIIYDDLSGNDNTRYAIAYSACMFFDDLTVEQLENIDMDALDEDIQMYESASIYTSERLSYLNNNNEEEIVDILKEYNTENINTACACAIWYDQQVQNTIYTIINKYLQ